MTRFRWWYIFGKNIKIWCCILPCCSVAKSGSTLCDPMNYSTPGSLSFTVSWSWLKFMSIELLIFCCPMFLPFHTRILQFVGFPRQEYWSGLPSPSLVDHILPEIFTVTGSPWVAQHSMAHSFFELLEPLCHNKAVIHEKGILLRPLCLPALRGVRDLTQRLPDSTSRHFLPNSALVTSCWLLEISSGGEGLTSFPGYASDKEPASNAGDVRDAVSIPGSGRFPGWGHGNPLQYSCLGNAMDRLKRLSVHALEDLYHGNRNSKSNITFLFLCLLILKAGLSVYQCIPRPATGNLDMTALRRWCLPGFSLWTTLFLLCSECVRTRWGGAWRLWLSVLINLICYLQPPLSFPRGSCMS